MACLYANNEYMKTGIENTISHNVLKQKEKKKCLDVNLTKQIQDFDTENYTTLMKEIKDLNK